jgi:formylglycine-generating enzyme required for sulfatase activity
MNRKCLTLICFSMFFHVYSQNNKDHKAKVDTKLSSVTVLGKQNNENIDSKKIDLNIKLVKVKGGEFIMGDINPRPLTPYYSDMPKHKVKLNDFYLADTEVTQALWKSVMNKNPSPYKGDDLPVCHVSWNATQEFISKLNQLSGKKYRLPTEAEWEYAAGAGLQKGTKFSGTNLDSELGDYAWTFENSEAKPHPVGTKKPNSLGLYDMTGNVWEWCSDYLGAYPSTPQLNPKGASTSSRRVNRGGGWMSRIKGSNLTLRNGFAPDSSNSIFGFRLAMDAE